MVGDIRMDPFTLYNRIAVLRFLNNYRGFPKSVYDMEQELEINTDALSNALTYLESDGLVELCDGGEEIMYVITSKGKGSL